jgi:hypothetical protein
MQQVKQVSVFLVNKPGVLANVCSALAREKVNISALTLSETSEHGVLRMVVDPHEKAVEVLKHLNIPHDLTDVLQMELPNRPGAMAQVAERLARDHVNIQYAYLSTGARGGRATGIFKVSHAGKAIDVLQKASQRKTTREAGVRRAF